MAPIFGCGFILVLLADLTKSTKYKHHQYFIIVRHEAKIYLQYVKLITGIGDTGKISKKNS